jgi:hypothetical protein
LVFSHPGHRRAIPIQNRNGEAKEEQVKLVLGVLEDLELI